jgi:hypothetical protein
MQIYSARGVQQGDPLGPLLFALSIHPMVLDIKNNFSELLVHLWFLDDGTMVGPPDVLDKAMKYIMEQEPRLGVHLNIDKCCLWWPGIAANSYPEVMIGVPRATEGGILVLGSPVGSKEFVEAHHKTIIDKLRLTLNKLRLMDDPQRQLLLLRSSLGMPKYNHLLRTGKPELVKDVVVLFDDMVNDFLKEVFGLKDFFQWDPNLRADFALPISMGGAGIPLAKDIAPAAYIGARIQFHQANPSDDLKAEIHVLLDKFVQTLAPGSDTLRREELFTHKHPQNVLTGFWYKSSVASALAGAVANRLHRLESNYACKSLWLKVNPNGQRSNGMEPEVFRRALRFRFGFGVFDAPVHESNNNCPGCSERNDVYGLHATRCRGGNTGMIHNGLVDFIVKEMRLARLQVETETLNLGHRVDRQGNVVVGEANGRKPADILYTPDNDGSPRVAYDLTVVSYHVSDGKIIREKMKFHKYVGGQHYQLDYGVNFLPIVLDSLGCFNDHLIHLFTYLAKFQARIMRKSVESRFNHLLTHFQFLLYKLLGRAILLNEPI